MATVKLVIDGARMAAFLRGPTGPVARYMIERGTAFQAAARIQEPRRTGCLQDSTVKRVEDYGGEIAIRVIADTTPCSPTRTSYSLFIHEGTAEHTVYAKPGGTLSFFWANGPNGAGQYYFKSVTIPARPPNRFFTDNLYLFAHA